MKHIFMNMAVVGLFSLGLASCSDELNISSIDPQSKTTYDDMELLAKQYATLGLTGQAGPAGKPDISADEGETGFTVPPSISRNFALTNVFGLGRMTMTFQLSPTSLGRQLAIVSTGLISVWHMISLFSTNIFPRQKPEKVMTTKV